MPDTAAIDTPIEINDPALKEWIGGDKVVAYNWSAKEGGLLVVTKAEDDNADYSLIRAFRVGGKVQVSVDANNRAPDGIIEILLDRRG